MLHKSRVILYSVSQLVTFPRSHRSVLVLHIPIVLISNSLFLFLDFTGVALHDCSKELFFCFVFLNLNLTLSAPPVYPLSETSLFSPVPMIVCTFLSSSYCKHTYNKSKLDTHVSQLCMEYFNARCLLFPWCWAIWDALLQICHGCLTQNILRLEQFHGCMGTVTELQPPHVYIIFSPD